MNVSFFTFYDFSFPFLFDFLSKDCNTLFVILKKCNNKPNNDPKRNINSKLIDADFYLF